MRSARRLPKPKASTKHRSRNAGSCTNQPPRGSSIPRSWSSAKASSAAIWIGSSASATKRSGGFVRNRADRWRRRQPCPVARFVSDGLQNDVAHHDQGEEYQNTDTLTDVRRQSEHGDRQARDDRPDQGAGDRREPADHPVESIELSNSRRWCQAEHVGAIRGPHPAKRDSRRARDDVQREQRQAKNADGRREQEHADPEIQYIIQRPL